MAIVSAKSPFAPTFAVICLPYKNSPVALCLQVDYESLPSAAASSFMDVIHMRCNKRAENLILM